MARATLKEVEGAIKLVNGVIEPCNAKIELGQRYNYKCIDLYQIKPSEHMVKYGSGPTLMETLQCGLSTSGALDYVRAMAQGLRIGRNPRGKCKMIKRRKCDMSWGVK